MEVGDVIQITGYPLIHISVVPIDDTIELDVSRATDESEIIYNEEASKLIATSRMYYDKAVKKHDNDRSTG